MKTNFDVYLEEQLKDPAFAERFERAGEAWDVALQIAALREKAGLSQKELARKLKTSQQQDQPPRISVLRGPFSACHRQETANLFPHLENQTLRRSSVGTMKDRRWRPDSF